MVEEASSLQQRGSKPKPLKKPSYSSLFTGSLFGAGTDVFALLFYVVAKAYKGTVELNPRLVAHVLGCTPERIQDAIDHLCKHEPQSTNNNEEGIVLEREGQWQYRVITGTFAHNPDGISREKKQ